MQKPAPASPPESTSSGPKLTIGAKLIGLIAALLLASVATIVTVATQLFTEDSASMIQQMNADKAASLSIQLREQLQSLTEKMRVMGSILMHNEKLEANAPLLSEYYAKDKDFVGVYVYRREEIGSPKAVAFSLSPEDRSQDPNGSRLASALGANPEFNPWLVLQGEVQVTTLSLADGSPAVAVSVPFITLPGTRPEENRFSHSLTGVIRQSKLMKAFGESDIVTTYLIDRRGKLLAHPETARVAAGEILSNVEIVRLFLDGKANNQQTRYMDPRSQESKLGAFRVVGFGGLGVVAEVAEAKAFEAAEKVQRRALYVALFVLSVAFFVGYVFSESIARPVRGLVEVARRIQSGDFNIAIRTRGRDEVARLSQAFNEMAQGLAERDRVKATFNKFHNKEIAEKLLSGEVKLGGERREATIFFSDVRGFTAMSEAMDPEQVVEMLNEYMTRMVAIIRKHNGVVDKYVGDAIMALWGVPVAQPDDTLNAVRACLEMRRELASLNRLRLERGQAELRIGMGLNHGVVIAGNIGSDEKMEYTVIGDAVNIASRMESMTKEYGTDLLIPKAVADRIADRFILERGPDAWVKGKSEALPVFQVKGFVDGQGNPVIVETPYSSYAPEKSDKAGKAQNVPDLAPEVPELHVIPAPAPVTEATPPPPPPRVEPVLPVSLPTEPADPAEPILQAAPMLQELVQAAESTGARVRPAGRMPGERTLTGFRIERPPEPPVQTLQPEEPPQIVQAEQTVTAESSDSPDSGDTKEAEAVVLMPLELFERKD